MKLYAYIPIRLFGSIVQIETECEYKSVGNSILSSFILTNRKPVSTLSEDLVLNKTEENGDIKTAKYSIPEEFWTKDGVDKNFVEEKCMNFILSTLLQDRDKELSVLTESSKDEVKRDVLKFEYCTKNSGPNVPDTIIDKHIITFYTDNTHTVEICSIVKKFEREPRTLTIYYHNELSNTTSLQIIICEENIWKSLLPSLDRENSKELYIRYFQKLFQELICKRFNMSRIDKGEYFACSTTEELTNILNEVIDNL